MKRRIGTVLAAVLMLMGMNMPSANAFYTLNLAGRPYTGNALNDCHGVAYGKVDGNPVLFMAAHCYRSDAVRAQDGSVLGYFLTEVNGEFGHDFAAIALQPNQWPSARNQIYRGTPTGLTTYWPIRYGAPSANLGCQNVGALMGRTVYNNFQTSGTSTIDFRTGTIWRWDQAPTYSNGQWYCRIESSLWWHGPNYKDSSSPWVLCCNAENYTNMVFGLSTGRTPGNDGVYGTADDRLTISPVYDGLKAMNDYWLTHGNRLGAYFCYADYCP